MRDLARRSCVSRFLSAAASRSPAATLAVPKGRGPLRRNLAYCLGACHLSGCEWIWPATLHTGGAIAEQQRHLLGIATGLMLIVAVPVFVMCAIFAWHFRASNTKATYDPHWNYSKPIDVVMWLVPTVLICILGGLAWIFSHRLDPYRPLQSGASPIEVQVIAQDWKWLFLYPEQGIAVVNELVFPSGHPLALKLTSDTVLNAFDIPGLGGQIYVMAGMQTELHLSAQAPREFLGRNVQFSGEGFSQQQFAVKAIDGRDFDAWVRRAKSSPLALNQTAYSALQRPSTAEPVRYYSAYQADLFDQVLRRYAPADRRPQPSVTTAMPPDVPH
jgi:cytochrome o ubiquinol oxidase subunit II